MAEHLKAVCNVRVGGKRVRPGDPFTLDDAGQAKQLVAQGAAEYTTDAAGPAAGEVDMEALGAKLQALVSEEQSLDALKAMTVPDLVKLTGIKAKRGEFDAALDLIVAEQHETAVIGRIGETILTLGDEAKGEDGAVNPDSVRAVQQAVETPWTDEQIAAAVVALSMTTDAE